MKSIFRSNKTDNKLTFNSTEEAQKNDIQTMSGSEQLKNLSFRAKSIVEGFMLGMHKSPYHGFSAEFSQHRPYQFGDETRHIDWTLYGRTDRFYIRQFQEETNLTAMLCVDNSSSMSFTSGTMTKFHYASLLASALAMLLFRQNDAAGLCLFNETIDEFIRPKAYSSYHKILTETLQNSSVKGGTHISSTLHQIAEKMKRRGLIILFSDLWDDDEAILKGLKHLKFQKQELLVFHILDPLEKQLNFSKKVAFKGLEENNTIKLDSRKIEKSYQNLIQQRENFFSKEFGELGIDYIPLNTDINPWFALQEYLIKRKRLH